MQEAIEIIERAGLVCKIYPDNNAESPDSWGEENEDMFIVTTDNRYFERKRKGFAIEDIKEHLETHKRYNGYKVYPLYAYIHSGIALSLGRSGQFSCPWDSGMIGYVLVKWKGHKRHESMAESLVETWNQFFSGDVYGIVIEDEQENVLDSCWGFYGHKYTKSEAESMLNYAIEQEMKKRIATGGNELQLS
jgi:hypothetical protein